MKWRNFWSFETTTITISVALVASLVALVCAAISVRVAYNAFSATTEAVSEARRQAQAAEAQIKIAEDSERRRLRAYVGLSGAGSAAASLLPPNVGTIRVGVRNYGQTPALRAQIESRIDMREFPSPPKSDFSVPVVVGKANPITIFPGDNDSTNITFRLKRPMTSDEIAKIADGTRWRIYAWGTIYYFDVFGAQHYTNFCMTYFKPEGNTASSEPCEEHNDSD
jgi:hypothetical protein